MVTQCRVTAQETSVHRDAAVEAVEVLAKRRPVPRHACVKCREWDALDARHQSHEIVAARERGEREPAIAAEHGRHSVEARRCRCGIPEQLRVVVRVHIDHAGADDETCHIDRASRRVGEATDVDDQPVVDGDVGDASRPA